MSLPARGVLAGDCLQRLAELPDATVDAVVTDPPYGLEFMGQKWDKLAVPKRGNLGGFADGTKPSFERVKRHLPAMQQFHQAWAAECLRLLKPGGHMLAFGGTRTWHRLACGIEDAGFELRDTLLAWVYASGFPKSRASLKPAWEPVVVARKCPAGTVAANVVEHGTGAANVVEHGTGALNIDAGRIGGPPRTTHADGNRQGTAPQPMSWGEQTGYVGPAASGRWPANLAFIHGDGCQPVGTRRVRASGHAPGLLPRNGDSDGGWRMQGGTVPHADPDGTETIEAWDCEPGCPVAELDRQSGDVKAGGGKLGGEAKFGPVYDGTDATRCTPFTGYADTGGASRFYFCAKAPASERVEVDGVRHPTVKPLALVRWLLRLVTPPDGLVLDPFLGSGTTAEAAILEGVEWVGCEAELKYLPLIAARVVRGEDDVAGRLFVGAGA